MVVGALVVPAVSAETIIDETIQWSADTSSTDTGYTSAGNKGTIAISTLTLKSIQNRQFVSYIGCTFPGNVKPAGLSEGENTVMYTLNGIQDSAKVYIQYQKNFAGTITYTNYLIFFDNWNIGTSTGDKTITFSTSMLSIKGQADSTSYNTPSMYWGSPGMFSSGIAYSVSSVNIASYTDIQNHITVKGDSNSYYISLIRNINGVAYPTRLETKLDSTVVYYHEGSTDIAQLAFFKSQINTIKLTAGSNTYERSLVSSSPAEDASGTINLYVKNSQTNALIADARVVISSGYYDPADLLVVSNTTLPSGTKTYTLQPTGGGLPNPDYYRVSVTADGYNAEMPYADITLDAGMSMTMVMGMEPTSGAPEDPGYTYIDVYVRDIYANPIADATVKMGVYTLKTNSAGYTLFDVPVNSTYAYTVKKTGYTSIEGSVTVANAARYTVNVVMGTGVIPTNTPTAEPTVPGATPTVPAGEETPGPGFIDQSAKNFATFLGVSYAVGRAALGMLIATAIGFTTARKLKGGAPEFGIGFIAGAALMVLITLLPAWIFIVMVIIVGGLLGYKYMNGGS